MSPESRCSTPPHSGHRRQGCPSPSARERRRFSCPWLGAAARQKRMRVTTAATSLTTHCPVSYVRLVSYWPRFQWMYDRLRTIRVPRFFPFPGPRRLMRPIVLAHDNFPDPFVGKFDFPARHRRLPWHPFDREADAALLDAPEEITFLEHGDRRRIGEVGRGRIEPLAAGPLPSKFPPWQGEQNAA